METVIPMVRTWGRYKHKDYKAALSIINCMADTDWKQACKHWIVRRAERNASKNAERRRGRQKMAHDN